LWGYRQSNKILDREVDEDGRRRIAEAVLRVREEIEQKRSEGSLRVVNTPPLTHPSAAVEDARTARYDNTTGNKAMAMEGEDTRLSQQFEPDDAARFRSNRGDK